jgi:PIN domain nuclease of toxin-antitoxin system
MNLLLDTHTLLWFLSGSKKLNSTSKKLIEDESNNCFVSIASVWEIAIKVSLKKLTLEVSLKELQQVMAQNKIQILPIEINHLAKLMKLKFHHRDPFDRIIIAQALVEKWTILTSDPEFKKYTSKVI